MSIFVLIGEEGQGNANVQLFETKDAAIRIAKKELEQYGVRNLPDTGSVLTPPMLKSGFLFLYSVPGGRQFRVVEREVRTR